MLRLICIFLSAANVIFCKLLMGCKVFVISTALVLVSFLFVSFSGMADLYCSPPTYSLLSPSLSWSFLHLITQGLFRLAAAASVVKKLKTCLDQEMVDHSEFSMDPHAVAGNDASIFFCLRLSFCCGQHDFLGPF